MPKQKRHLSLLARLSISFFQELVVLPCKVLIRLWGGYTVNTAALPPLSRGQHYVVAGNHQSMLDPFAIFALLPLRQRMRLLPLKFMTAPSVYHIWYLKPFCYLLGCFPAHIRDRKHHTYGVEGTLKLMRYGYNICIFPEGTRTRRENSDPKYGIVRILESNPDVTLLLAHLEWTVNARGKRHLSLTVAPAADRLDKTSPKAIMDAIYEL